MCVYVRSNVNVYMCDRVYVRVCVIVFKGMYVSVNRVV